MRQLQVVGVSEDGRLALLASSPGARPSHCLEIDARLERVVRGQPVEEGPAQTSSLSPRDIQSRLRSGATVEQVAREAGVPIARIERYAGPVLSEREQVLSAARASTMTRPRGSSSVLPLGPSIAANVRALAYARPDTAEWTAYRLADGEWIVRYDITIRGRRRRAEWTYHAAAREVTALNSYATSLGLVETVRPRAGAAAGALEEPTKKPAAGGAARGKKAVPVKAPLKKAAAKEKAAAKAVAVKTPAKKVPAKKAAVVTRARPRAGTK